MLFAIGLGLVASLIVVSLVLSFHATRRLRQLAAQREGDSICRFARSLDYRRLDTKVIRAVYEGFQSLLGTTCPSFPVRAADDIDQVYRFDSEDLEDLCREMAERCGRSLDDSENNPFFNRVRTVADLIEFFCVQPRLCRAA